MKLVINATPRQLYARERHPVPLHTTLVSPRAGLKV